MRKIIPVAVRASSGTYVASDRVRAVFDTNAAGELLEVPFRPNPVDDVEFMLEHTPHGQVYAEIKT